jgi:hypothetical protein
MLLDCVAVPGEYPYSSNLLDQESRAAACRQGSAAKSTRLFSCGFERSPMPSTDCGRRCGPCAYPLSAGEDPIGFCRHGALEDVLLEMVENARVRTFSWQRGYGAFSVSQSNVASVVSYIEKQEEHHRTVIFAEEFRLFLKRYRVAFDERYVWD